jgi:hypothetical protein
MFETRRLSLGCCATLAVALVLPSCGSGGVTLTPPRVVTSAVPSGGSTSSGLTPGATVAGSISLPNGMNVSPSTLIVADTYGTKPVSASGTFSIGVYDADPQFATVTTAGGTSLLTGWLSSSSSVMSAQSTAEVYFYLATFAYALPDPAARVGVIASIHTLPGLSSVTNAISAALVAHPTLSPSSDPGVNAALSALATSLGGANAAAALSARGGVSRSQARLHTSALGIMPGTSASGITLVTGDTDEFSFMNSYRRDAAAFIDEVSHVDGTTGATVTDQAPDTNAPVDVAAVAGIGSFLGSISDYLNGAYALVPTTGEPNLTPNVEGAKSTTYRVAVVGPGANAGDFASLTAVEMDKQTETVAETAVYELVLPLIAAILVPAAKPVGSDNKFGNALIKDVIGTISKDARIRAAAQSGDTKAVFDIVCGDLAESTALTELMLTGVEQLLEIAPANAATEGAAEITKALATPIEVVDGGIAVVDTSWIVADAAKSDQADIFTVTTTDATTTLTPASSMIDTSATVTLTAGVHPPPAQALVYQYTNTALFGHLTDNTGSGHLDNFTSSSATVTYTGNATGGGTDTITVTPELVVTGQPNTPLSKATATVAVGPAPQPTPSPIPVACQNATGDLCGTYVLTGSVSGPPVAASPKPIYCCGVTINPPNGFVGSVQITLPNFYPGTQQIPGMSCTGYGVQSGTDGDTYTVPINPNNSDPACFYIISPQTTATSYETLRVTIDPLQ